MSDMTPVVDAIREQTAATERNNALQERVVMLLEGQQRTAVLPEESVSSLSSGQTGHPQIIVDQGRTYTRQTHPALFKVVDLLADDKTKRGASVRQLETLTGVSKSWCSVAKRYWLANGNEER